MAPRGPHSWHIDDYGYHRHQHCGLGRGGRRGCRRGCRRVLANRRWRGCWCSLAKRRGGTARRGVTGPVVRPAGRKCAPCRHALLECPRLTRWHGRHARHWSNHWKGTRLSWWRGVAKRRWGPGRGLPGDGTRSSPPRGPTSPPPADIASQPLVLRRRSGPSPPC